MDKANKESCEHFYPYLINDFSLSYSLNFFTLLEKLRLKSDTKDKNLTPSKATPSIFR